MRMRGPEPCLGTDFPGLHLLTMNSGPSTEEIFRHLVVKLMS